MTVSATVLVTGIGSPGAYGIIRSFRQSKDIKFRIIGIDVNPGAVGAAWVDKFLVGPSASDVHFVDKVIELCENEKIDVVFPMVSKELYPLAQSRNKFALHKTILAVSSPGSLEVANHKGKLFRALQQYDIPVPHYRQVQTVSELDEGIDWLGYPEVPVCFKPVYGDGSRGFRILDDEVDHAKILFSEKPNSVYISRSELSYRLSSVERIPELLVMEYLPGDEYSVDLLVDNGNVLAAIPRRREATVGGITTRGTIVLEPDVIEYASAVVKSLHLHGNIGVQVKRNRDGKPLIVEVNPRLQGTTVHCSAAGVNLPYLGAKLALGLPIDDKELNVNWGTKMIRYWDEVYIDANGLPYAFELL